jgi:UPF0176 protein
MQSQSDPASASALRTPDEILVGSFYRFELVDAQKLDEHRVALNALGRDCGLRGLVLLAAEGVNATVSGNESSVRAFISGVAQHLGHAPYRVKESWAPSQPFKRFQVQIRPEIVTFLGEPYRPSPADEETHLSPERWNEMLASGHGASGQCLTVLDVRNEYESKLGTFKGAITPPLKNFGELRGYLESQDIPRDAPLLMFCTGGIRCEKALPELRRAGFSEVYQLDGGILNYFERCGSTHNEFEGECFVFDHRVAVRHDLSPSARYKLCPHCGNPGDLAVSCGRCSAECVICADCRTRPERVSCSKNCAHHLNRSSGR